MRPAHALPPILLMASLLATACASHSAEPALSSSEYMGEDRVETAARLLAIAADSQDSADARHMRAVSVLTRLGVRADEGEEDIVAEWSASLPADSSPPMRGRLLGPAYRSGTLPPGKSISTEQLFEGGRQAQVSISGKNHAPLRVMIQDRRNNNVCDPAPGNPRNCRWTPAYSSRYEITVSNPGDQPVTYFLVIG
ncbi:MAG: hypothetical protein IE921_17000 [Rhodobacteraceae bacterium]|nr:hypothetical protein [Paracoccaceae bacterium]